MVGVPFLVRRCEAGPSSADRLPLALLQPQRGDDRRTEEEDEEEPGSRGAERAEREIAEQVEDAGQVRKLGQPGQHRTSYLLSRWAKTLAQRRDERTHPAAVRAFDHRDVAAAQRRGDFVRQFARPLGPGGPHRGRRRIEERARQRPGAEQKIDLVGAEVGGEFGVHRRRLRPELQHVADDGDAAPVRPGLRRAEQRQRRAHRGRIGVVAFVDDGRRPVGRRRSRSARPCPSAARSRPAPRRRRRGRRRALRPRAARRARSPPYATPGAPRSNANSRPRIARLDARAAVDRRRPRSSLRVAIARRAEGQDARAVRHGALSSSRSNCGASRLSTARPARLEAEEDLGLRVGDRFDRAEMFDVDGRDRRHQRDMRPRHAGERRDLAGVVHADLEHAEARRSAGMRASVSGTPQ